MIFTMPLASDVSVPPARPPVAQCTKDTRRRAARPSQLDEQGH